MLVCGNLYKSEKRRSGYYDIYFRFKVASEEYRSGNLFVEFPEGTYRPYVGPVT